MRRILAFFLLFALLPRGGAAILIDSYRKAGESVTESFVARLGLQGGSLTAPKSAAYLKFVKAAMANGYFSKVLDCGTFEGTTLAQSYVKLWTSGTYANALTSTGPTNASLLAGGGTNITETGYWSTGVNINSQPVGTFGMMSWISGFTASTPKYYIGVPTAISPNELIGNLGSGTQGYSRGVYTGGSPSALSAPLSTGMVHVERNSATSLKSYVNGRQALATATTTATAAANAVSRLEGGSHFYAITDGTFTATDALNIVTDVKTLLTSLGRITFSSQAFEYSFGIGQSLMVGTTAAPVVTGAEPYTCRRPMGQNDPAGSVQPDGQRALVNYSERNSLESPGGGFVHTLAKLHRDNGGSAEHDLTFTNWAIGGYPYSFLKKGGSSPAYANSIESVVRALQYAPFYTAGTFSVPAIMCVHGESDAQLTTYQADIRQWQLDYETDIKALTGQSGRIPIFHSQMSSWTSTTGANAATLAATGSPYAVLAEHELNPTKTILVCPKYFLPSAVDGVHLINTSSRLLGEYYGKAWYQHIVQGVQWEPLRPTSIVRSGATITATFAGATGGLAFDTTNVTDPGNKGFEWAQTGGVAQTISSVAITGANQVTITLSGDPGTPTAQRLRYAFTGTAGQNAGPTTGARGNLCNSDTRTGQSGTVLKDWCVHFDKPVL